MARPPMPGQASQHAAQRHVDRLRCRDRDANDQHQFKQRCGQRMENVVHVAGRLPGATVEAAGKASSSGNPAQATPTAASIPTQVSNTSGSVRVTLCGG
jgi:hypothetical protein